MLPSPQEGAWCRRLPGAAHNGPVSRVSGYGGLDLAALAEKLRSAGLDPAAVSLACALGRHGDCDGTVEAPRPPGQPAARCSCPGAHAAGHDPAGEGGPPSAQ